MNRNKLTFESENLVVNYISFNIEGLFIKKYVKRIVKYLFQNFGVNSIFAIGLKRKKETLLNDSKNKHQVYFRVYKYSDIYWDGIKIDFSGNNGHQFYNFIVANQVNWEIFNQQKDLRLSLFRLDLYYLRNKTKNNTNVESFLKQCYDKVHANNQIKILAYNEILSVGF